MLTIGEVSKRSGLAAHTIRYYEKIGLLPLPDRINGKDRLYSEKNIRFLHYLLSLKDSGLSLAELKEIVDTGCLLDVSPDDHKDIISRRKEILEKHLEKLLLQQKSLHQTISQTEEKLAIYQGLLKG